MIKISTKTGDVGLSSLANGLRLAKTHPIFGVLGELDELNSWLGVSVVQLEKLMTLHPRLARERDLILSVQQWLYQVSAVIAAAPKFELELRLLKSLEKAGNQLQKKLEPHWHTNFLYPGGSEVASWFDVARAVARRVERNFLIWQKQSETPFSPTQEKAFPEIQKTLNRLSDYLYLLRCWSNVLQQVNEKEFHRTKRKTATKA